MGDEVIGDRAGAVGVVVDEMIGDRTGGGGGADDR